VIYWPSRHTSARGNGAEDAKRYLLDLVSAFL